MEGKSYDVFLCYAPEDKSFAERLAYFLMDAGLDIWQGGTPPGPGGLEGKIKEGTLNANSGIIILSRNFLAKHSSKEEVIAGLNKERDAKILIPIWHDIAYRDVEEIVPFLTDTNISNSETHSLDQIIEDILKVVVATEKKKNYRSGNIELTSINNTDLVVLPLSPYNEWAVAIGKHPVTNKQYNNFLKNVKSDIIDEIIHNYVSETIHVDYLKSNFHKPCGKLVDDDNKEKLFYPHEDERFNLPDCPVVCISLIEAIGYVSWLNSALNFSGYIFTLVSPQLWRYAAFGTLEHSTYAIDHITQHNMVHRALHPQPVIKTDDRSNSLGISDMFGNVWEWCEPDVQDMNSTQHTDDETDKPAKTIAEIAGGGYSYDLEHISPFLTSEMLENDIFTKRSDLGFRIAALVNVKNLEPKIKEQLIGSDNSDAPFVEHFFNRNYKYY